MDKKVLVLGAAVLALVIVGGVYWRMQQNRIQVPKNDIAEQQQKGITTKQDVDTSKLPENFPVDIPLEPNGPVTENFNVADKDGYTQATRSFQTNSTLADNLKLYKKYMTDNGYKISTTLDQPTYKMLYAIKDQRSLRIEMTENSISKAKTVTISYTEN